MGCVSCMRICILPTFGRGVPTLPGSDPFHKSADQEQQMLEAQILCLSDWVTLELIYVLYVGIYANRSETNCSETWILKNLVVAVGDHWSVLCPIKRKWIGNKAMLQSPLDWLHRPQSCFQDIRQLARVKKQSNRQYMHTWESGWEYTTGRSQGPRTDLLRFPRDWQWRTIQET